MLECGLPFGQWKKACIENGEERDGHINQWEDGATCRGAAKACYGAARAGKVGAEWNMLQIYYSLVQFILHNCDKLVM